MNLRPVLKTILFIALLSGPFLQLNPVFGAIYVVTNTMDSGAGSLRQAITNANSNAGLDTINFNLSGTGPTITVSSNLPVFSEQVFIDGTSQPGFVSGSQSTYVKVGTSFGGTIFQASNVTNITVKGLDLSYNSPRAGVGISFSNCNTTFIINNYIQNRNIAVSISSGSDHTLQQNNFISSGQDNNNPALNFSSIIGNTLLGGLAMSDNIFGGTTNATMRMTNMSNLIIGDETVMGAQIVFKDNSGLANTGDAGQTVFQFSNITNITLDNLNLARTSKLNSNCISISNGAAFGNIAVKNCDIKNRYSGIVVSGGRDYTIQNNNLKGTGENGQYAVLISTVSASALPGGILMSGNLWGRNGVNESRGGLRIQNMNNLTIGDADTGVHIKLEDASGLNEVEGNSYGDRGALLMENVSNIVVDDVDFSWSLIGVPNSFGLRINNGPSNSNITIKNCQARNRYMGVYCSDGKDYTITNNDLRGSGWEDAAALTLLSIAPNFLPGGVLVHSNLYGRNPTGNIDPNSIGLLISNMSNLTIGDAGTGVEIKIEDNSGMNTFATNSADRRGCLYLDDVSNIVVDNVDCSWSRGGVVNGFGIYVENETFRGSNVSTTHQNVVIKNCDVHNRYNGIRIRGGRDYTVINNDMRACGNGGYYSLELGNIQANTMPGGILAHSNIFGTNPIGPTNPSAQNSEAGVYLQAVNNLTIGDATTGVHIKLEDNCGLNQVVGQNTSSFAALYMINVNNIVLNNVDCGKATTGQANSVGIRVQNANINNTITITNCSANNRNRGIWIDGGKDYTVTNNNLTGSGNSEPALEFSNILKGLIPGGISVFGNTFGTPNFNRGVYISNMRNLVIGDASVMGANIVLEDNSGLNQCDGSNYGSLSGVLQLASVDSVEINDIDASKITAGAGNSHAIYISNSQNNQVIAVKNCRADNRFRGIYINGGKDYTIQNNTITNSGNDSEANALDIRNVTSLSLLGGVAINGNTFGNVPNTSNISRSGVRFDNMRDLTIGDAMTGGNVKFEDGNGFGTVGFDQNSSYAVLTLNNVTNSSIEDVDFSSTFPSPSQRNTGIRISNALANGNISIKNNLIVNRRTGLQITSGRDYYVMGNNFTQSGANSNEPAVNLSALVKNTLDGGISMRDNIFGGSNSNCALKVEDMTSFTIGDTFGDDIYLDDTSSGLENVGNISDYVLYFNQLSDVSINGLKLTRAGGSQLGYGIRINGGNGNKNISVTNCEIRNRVYGLHIIGGKDYTITGNDFTTTGLNITFPALHISSVTGLSLTGGVNIASNTFGGVNANSAVKFENMSNLGIGDATTGTNVKFEDGTSGFNNVGNLANSNEPVLYLTNVSSSFIKNVDVSRTGSTPYGSGIRIDNSLSNANVEISGNVINFRRTGIYLNGGGNYNVVANDVRECGAGTQEPALYLYGVNLSGSKKVYNNLFGGTNYIAGLRIENSNNIVLGDSTNTNANIEIRLSNNFRSTSGTPLQVINSGNITVESMDLSNPSMSPLGTGLSASSSTNLIIKNLVVTSRLTAISVNSGTTNQIQCSNLSSNTTGLSISGGTGYLIENNSFVSNTGFAVSANTAVTAENNYFGGGAPTVGGPNGISAVVDATPYLSSPPSGCPTALTPEIEVKGNTNQIIDGSTAPSTSNFTDLGSAKPLASEVKTYIITNLGGAALNVSSISTTGTHSSEFVPGVLTPAGPIMPGTSASFTITFTPTVAGLRSAILEIQSDDADEALFNVAIQGTGKAALVVTKTADTNDGVCDADCSLREAITVANSNADADVIEFSIGSGAQTINIASAFPNITNPISIDGASQPGYAGSILITINATNNITTFNFLNATGITVNDLYLNRSSGYDGTGMAFNNCNDVVIIKNRFNNKYNCISVNGGRDYTILNNIFKNCGINEQTPAVSLNSITAGNIPGGISMSGNIWGYDNPNAINSWYLAPTALAISNMSNLIIGDASVSNANIVIEDGTSGLNLVGYNQTCCETACLNLTNVNNITIDNVDFSHSYPSPLSQSIGRGILVNNNSNYKNVTIKNCNFKFRSRGIDLNGGADYTILNNDFRNTGRGEDDACIRLSSIQGINIPGGITASGNTFGLFGSVAGGTVRIGTALKLQSMSNLIIGDASVMGAHIVINDGELNNFQGFDPNCCFRSIFSLADVSDITIDNIDFAYLPSVAAQLGYAISIVNSANNKNVIIRNCDIRNRYKGVHITGGKDYAVYNNDMRNTGGDNSSPALYLSGVRPGVINAGISAYLNKYGTPVQAAKTALRIDNMDGLLIGDENVMGANIVIEDNSGANTLNNDGDQAAIYMLGVSNIGINSVDVSRSAAGRSGAGIWIENSGNQNYQNISILNTKAQQRDMALFISGGKDVTVKDNDFRYSGSYTERPTVYLSSIAQHTIPGGAAMSGNLFGGINNGAISDMGVRFENMRDMIIGDASVTGRTITFEDNCGLNNLGQSDANNRGALFLGSVSNVIVDNLDLSRISSSNSFALYINNSTNVIARNNYASYRFRGFYVNGGRDISVYNNDLRFCGINKDQPALHFSSVNGQNLPGGIYGHHNLFGGNTVRTGLRLDNMENVVIGDGGIANATFTIEDNSGMNNFSIADGNSENPPIFFTNVSNITVDNIDASFPTSGSKNNGGITVSNNVNNHDVVIRNCNFNNRLRAIFCTGGRDYTITDNTLLNSGNSSDQPAIYLQNIQGSSLMGGISMAGNTFGGTLSLGGIRFENMRDLAIGDASVTSANVVLEDNCGLNNMGATGNSSVYYVLHLNNVHNAVVDNIDVSRPLTAATAQDVTGIRVDNNPAHGPVTIMNCDIRRHRTGINIQGGKDYIIQNNDLRGCGISSEEPALYVNNITQIANLVPMGFQAYDNKFGSSGSVTSASGLRLENLSNLRVSNAMLPGVNIGIKALDSLRFVTGITGLIPGVITLRNVSEIVVDSLNIQYTGTQTGVGINVLNDNASQFGIQIKNNLITNKISGIKVSNGSDYTITGNLLTMCGNGEDNPALRINFATAGNLPGGLILNNNVFGGSLSQYGIKLLNMSNLKISDGSLIGTNVNLGNAATNGFKDITSGIALHLSAISNSIVSNLDLSRGGTTRQGTGLRLTSGVNNIVEKTFIQGRDVGINIVGSTSETLKCNTLYDNNFGIDFNNSIVNGLLLYDNSMMCNTTGMRNAWSSTINAMGNYWGATNGPSNLGGTGNGYSGPVNGAGFLINQAACAPLLPDLDLFGNDLLINDGDLSPAFTDNTLICGIEVGQSSVVQYKLKNKGQGTIILTGSTPVTVTPTSAFSVDSQPMDLELAPGDSSIFSIKFMPASVGQFQATVNIANKTCDTNPYYFTIQGNGCVPITASLSRDTNFCIGSPMNVKINIAGGQAPFTVSLSDGNTYVVNTTGVSYISVNPLVNTSYTLVKVVDANNCCAALTGSSAITISPLPVPTITESDMSGVADDDLIICSGDGATLNAGAFVSWAWSNMENTQSIQVGAAGTYTVTVTDVNGCTNTDDITLTVNTSPSPAIAVVENSGMANDGILCGSGNALLDAGSFDTYVWSTMESSQTINVSTANTFTVTVTDANGCSGTDNQAIVFTTLTTAQISGSHLVCAGATTIDIPITTTGSGPFTVVLSDNSIHTVNTAGSSMLTANVTLPLPNVFTILSISDAGGCTGTTSGVASVIADNIPPVADCKDVTITLDITQSFTLTPSIINDNSSDNCGSPVLSITSGIVNYSCTHVPGSYTVELTVTDGSGLTNSCTSQVTVEPNPIVPCCSGALTLVGPTSICPGSNTSFTMSPVLVPGGVWSSSNNTQLTINPTTGEITSNGDVNVSSTITYTVTQYGCTQEVASIVLNVITPNLIQNGDINNPANWELGCIPSMAIPNGTPIIIDFDLTVPVGVIMEYHGDLMIEPNKSIINHGTLNSHGGKIMNSGTYKGTGSFNGNLINRGVVKP